VGGEEDGQREGMMEGQKDADRHREDVETEDVYARHNRRCFVSDVSCKN
jgi:hypothetical protein